MLTLPDSTSSIAGTIRAGTPARRAMSNTERTTSPRADGIAISTSSIDRSLATPCNTCSGPSTGRPRKVTVRLPGSSSRKPTGSSPASGWRCISLAISTPASPAPTTSTRRASGRAPAPSWKSRDSARTPPHRSIVTMPSISGMLRGRGKYGEPTKKETADASAVKTSEQRAICDRSLMPTFRHDWR
ncbi:MAG: hypothetical protein BWY99_02682 [Synergistetes bacterium ADurb.BinA166]|nr:MAG: hypothetical protein BWY99_02682 [Synergistetes bacterium ADurb.BinA166]